MTSCEASAPCHLTWFQNKPGENKVKVEASAPCHLTWFQNVRRNKLVICFASAPCHLTWFQNLVSHECVRLSALRIADKKRESRNQIYSSSFTFIAPSHVSNSRFNVSMFSEKLDLRCCVSSSSFASCFINLRYFCLVLTANSLIS